MTTTSRIADRSEQIRDLFDTITPFPAALVFVSYADEDAGALEGLWSPLDGDWSWIHHQVDGGWLLEMVPAEGGSGQ